MANPPEKQPEQVTETAPEMTDALRRAFRARVVDAVRPLLDAMDPSRVTGETAAALTARFPQGGDVLEHVRALLREGRETRALGERENDGVRFSRVKKAEHDGDFTIDYVWMNGPGPGHVHPNGEIDLCFAVEGDPRFDGQVPGFTSYGPGSWHVPTVSGGAMDILYFLPGGAITFGPDPKAS